MSLKCKVPSNLKRLDNVILMILLIGFLVIILFFNWYNLSAYSVISTSMDPTIPKGSLTINQEETFKELDDKDIITYKLLNSEVFITHRITSIDKETEMITCKGDANEVVDPNDVSYSLQYKSSVLFYIPYLGYIAYFAKTIYGRILLITLIMVLVAIIYKKKKA